MKFVALLVVLAGMMVTQTGCLFRTPAYTASERHALIKRNVVYEAQQITDDWDHFWMLRPASQLTIWNLQGVD